MELFVLCPNHIIGEKDTATGRLGLGASRVDHFVVGVFFASNLWVARFDGIMNFGHLERFSDDGPLFHIIVVIGRGLKVMFYTERLYGKPHNMCFVQLCLSGMILNLNSDMVVNIRLLISCQYLVVTVVSPSTLLAEGMLSTIQLLW